MNQFLNNCDIGCAAQAEQSGQNVRGVSPNVVRGELQAIGLEEQVFSPTRNNKNAFSAASLGRLDGKTGMQDSFKTNVQEFFNSPILRELEKLRDTRYWQTLLVFWSLGLAAAVEVSQEMGMLGARDLALQMEADGEGKVLDQFSNPDNPDAHYKGTGPEIWEQSRGMITHFVSSMGTTGTIMGASRFFKERNPAIEIVGLQPTKGSAIPGIRRWPAEYMPEIFDESRVDRIIDISQQDSEETMRDLAAREGIFCGVSSGGAVAGALQIAKTAEIAVIVAIICDRGDRYISTGVFDN